MENILLHHCFGKSLKLITLVFKFLQYLIKRLNLKKIILVTWKKYNYCAASVSESHKCLYFKQKEAVGRQLGRMKSELHRKTELVKYQEHCINELKDELGQIDVDEFLKGNTKVRKSS
jgi:hypothetical protein